MIFIAYLAIEFPEILGRNKHVIELIEGKQSSYKSIYSPNTVELKTLKVYIKTHLKIRFIWPSKSFLDAFIIFNKILIEAYDYTLIIKISITSQLKIIIT